MYKVYFLDCSRQPLFVWGRVPQPFPIASHRHCLTELSVGFRASDTEENVAKHHVDTGMYVDGSESPPQLFAKNHTAST